MENNQPRGLRNNNWLNIRRNPANKWQGARKTISDFQFEEFVNPIWGIRAAFCIIRNWLANKRLRIRTVSQIISRWAPPSENNTGNYIDTVCKLAECQPNEVITYASKNTLCRVLRAMAIVENGQQYKETFHFQYFETAYEYAKKPYV